MPARLSLEITGIVQGVGFRPFIYNLASRLNLKGYILNDSTGVHIEAEGDSSSLKSFVETIKKQPPPLSRIQEIKAQELPFLGYTDFIIKESRSSEEKSVLISPDVATCKDCLKELKNPENFRYRYPFINCTNCGPRFTIIKDVPYDRGKTSMSEFPMCPVCSKEYHEPSNRRFHAQPNACPECGPSLELLDSSGKRIACEDVLKETVKLLKDGKIVAVKGLGGFHLACDAKNEKAVSTLRARKYREDKPFALMVKDFVSASSICNMTKEDEVLLQSHQRPIVLMEKKKDSGIAKSAAPGQKNLGVMLPYTPLHTLILEESNLVLVMTSGNISDEPIAFENNEGLKRLKNIADYFLLHNRKIITRCDDAVTRTFRGKEFILRRSRGYAPYPIILPWKLEREILACGAELKNTFCLGKENVAFLSHHIGDLENLETYQSFSEGIKHYEKLFDIKPDLAAYDLHPRYFSTQYALELPLEAVGIQHHHAHIASVMAEYGIKEKVIGVSLDGTGYGTDGAVWGGEFLICDLKDFVRAAHLEYMPMPGGEKAIKEPWRMALSYLDAVYGENLWNLNLDLIRKIDGEKGRALIDAVKKGVASPMTSSMGRLFDAVSSILDIRQFANYEAQPAIELEMRAAIMENASAAAGNVAPVPRTGESGGAGTYPFEMKDNDGKLVISVKNMIKQMVDDFSKGIELPEISFKFHRSISKLILEVCRVLKSKTGLSKIICSGGVFQNMLLLKMTVEDLEKEGFEVLLPSLVPVNDGGISLGQLVIANERCK